MIERTITTMGMAWYSPEAWRQLEAFPKAGIKKSYRDYLRDFKSALRNFASQGIKVEKFSIDIDRMIAWCHRRAYEIDDKGGAVYGAMLVMARDHPDALDAPIVDNTRVVQ